MKIAAILLAAGEGRRIGGPKALLPIGGDSFLARVAATLARPGVSRLIAVLGCQAERVRAEAGAPPEVTLVVNGAWREGMLGSILAGLEVAERDGAEAVLLQPVDHPLVEPATVDGVVAALRSGARIAVPSDGRRRGHPGGFARSTWGALRSAPAERGAKAVLAEHPDWVVHVAAGPGAFAGIDTPEDYARLVGPMGAVTP
jgi:CTP:molybdopterin cytidylyltransferase MocA